MLHKYMYVYIYILIVQIPVHTCIYIFIVASFVLKTDSLKSNQVNKLPWP